MCLLLKKWQMLADVGVMDANIVQYPAIHTNYSLSNYTISN